MSYTTVDIAMRMQTNTSYKGLQRETDLREKMSRRSELCSSQTGILGGMGKLLVWWYLKPWSPSMLMLLSNPHSLGSVFKLF